MLVKGPQNAQRLGLDPATAPLPRLLCRGDPDHNNRNQVRNAKAVSSYSAQAEVCVPCSWQPQPRGRAAGCAEVRRLWQIWWQSRWVVSTAVQANVSLRCRLPSRDRALGQVGPQAFVAALKFSEVRWGLPGLRAQRQLCQQSLVEPVGGLPIFFIGGFRV